MALGMTNAEAAAARRKAATWTIRSGARRAEAVAGQLEELFAAWDTLPNELLFDVRLRPLAKALEGLESAMEDD